ncbi:major antigen isoform X2 [Sorghum bicolor]|nr:major antigen isoform X2 [Sorghum bicolor]|eukprot:XP_021309557.1 major antigen isoform X2 [Sorghum bicolor]
MLTSCCRGEEQGKGKGTEDRSRERKQRRGAEDIQTLGLGASAEGGDQRAAGRGLGGGRTSQWGGAAGDEETNGEELSGGEEHELVEKEVPGREERRRQDLPGGEESRPRDLLPGEERSRRDLLPGRVAASQGGRDEHEQMSSSSNGHYPANGAKVHRKEKNKEKVQLDKNAASSACQKDRHYIEKLETELMNCYQEIDYLQDQLNIRSVEANIMGEHIHSLELKLTELEKFPERVRLMDNELIRSDSQCWLLMEEVRCKEEELQKAAAQIEKLESTALDSQCEIESLKLDLTNLEQRLLDAESFTQHAAEHKAQIEKLLGEHELQLHEAQKTIDQLVLENKQLKELLPVRAPKQSPSRSGQQVDKTLENGVRAECESGDVILEKMAKRNEESELLIEQLKEELREQKLKAKEDAEDLTQEMAELRYQITGMLEEEYKRRSCIEQAAIQHIQELETQVSKEKTKLSGALRRLQESHELAHAQAMEIKKLKAALERFNSATNLGSVCKSCSCGFSAMLIELSNCSIEGPSGGTRSPNPNHIDEKSQNQALIEWRPGEASDGDGG